MRRKRRWQIERMFPDGLSHPADNLAERKFFRPGNAEGLVRETGIAKRSDDYRYEIFHGHGTDLPFLHSDKPENGKCVQCVAEVVQHVVAPPVNHTRFENGAVEARTSHDFFGGPFRFVIRGATVWPRPQETQQHYLSDAS